MKRTRKLTIEIRQRQITVALSLRGNVPGESGCTPENAEGGRAASRQDVPKVCPFCGLPGMMSIADALVSSRDYQDALIKASAVGDIHISRSGRSLWLCQHSLTSFLAQLPLDSRETQA